MKPNSKLIIIDSNYICHVIYHSLSSIRGNSEIIFGFLRQILTIAEKFDTNRFVFCWDSKHSKRKKIYKEYKAHRKELTRWEKDSLEIAYKQFSKIRTYVLPTIGFTNIFQQKGYEADDLIASIIEGRNRLQGWKGKDYSKPIIVSADNDLYQLLEFCDMYNLKSKTLYTREDLKEEWGVEPWLWKEAKIAGGCQSDNVKGINGVGLKTACKFLTGKLKENSSIYKLIYENLVDGKMAEKNARLIILPFKGTKRIDKLEKNKFSLDGFLDVCDIFDLQSFLKGDYLSKWKRRFFK